MHGAPDGPAKFSSVVEQLKTNPSPDAPKSDGQKVLTYDEMILALLMQVFNDAKEKGVDKNNERLREVLIANLKGHCTRLGETQEKLRAELNELEDEKNKKITSENLHDGWDSHVCLWLHIYSLNFTYLAFAVRTTKARTGADQRWQENCDL